MTPLVISMTGATGAIYGIRLLQVLREKPIEVHLVLSTWAEKTKIGP
jgi:3-polyprenyl-4-hydroxybenzoate decarboxylase